MLSFANTIEQCSNAEKLSVQTDRQQRRLVALRLEWMIRNGSMC